jgi:transcriptional regulator with XRE-family HTH domain
MDRKTIKLLKGEWRRIDIKPLREALGSKLWTQAKLAMELDIPTNTVASWENEHRYISNRIASDKAEKLSMIAKDYGVDVLEATELELMQPHLLQTNEGETMPESEKDEDGTFVIDATSVRKTAEDVKKALEKAVVDKRSGVTHYMIFTDGSERVHYTKNFDAKGNMLALHQQKYMNANVLNIFKDPTVRSLKLMTATYSSPR